VTATNLQTGEVLAGFGSLNFTYLFSDFTGLQAGDELVDHLRFTGLNVKLSLGTTRPIVIAGLASVDVTFIFVVSIVTVFRFWTSSALRRRSPRTCPTATPRSVTN
jgi:hypothetical protein